MATLIKIRQVVEDSWQLLEPAADGTLPAVPAAGDVIVPLALWQRERDKLVARAGRTGVWLAGADDPEALAGDLPQLAVIAVSFPKLTDGRGYSTARLLRERYGYRGELRAIGDVNRDQLLFLARCGFDAFALKDRRDPNGALAAFSEFSETYQGAADGPLPLFRRRPAAAAENAERPS